MHEMALMGDILNLISIDMEKHNFTIVKEVELIVGDLSNALPDALEMAFLVYKKQGVSGLQADSQLTIIRERSLAECIFCNLEYEPDQRLALCPSCGLPGGKIMSGDTFKIRSYEGE
ncbi:hydrogenase maturation nickel metallochaperone HypA [Bacillus solimangrovi]|uniref:Hydrogenase nickel incorporation protein HypA n=1 Tax=Bacillus solimangrovi TaxID=1305675 RepID=A0A1E5LFG6_9BACI|nr:hydrogenase maturation nickel metallochaperone HypA [Bacillus solimangrovi]OEH92812.1 hydrogenase nickel incorporation protein HypA [Bacillus solimangrovi]